MYTVSKTYGHELGLSCCFRQKDAMSHCRKLHGYSLSFSFTFACKELCSNGWVVDFGGLKWVLEFLRATFDHKLLVCKDDLTLLDLPLSSVADVVVLDSVGCEAFARMVAEKVNQKLMEDTGGRVWLLDCSCSEHGANTATYHLKR